MDLDTIYKHFPDEDSCLAMLERVRWGEHPECPYCGVRKSCPIRGESRHHCNNCQTSFSVTAQTMFHKRKIDMRKWLLAMLLATDPRRTLKVREMAEAVGVNKNTAHQMLLRIRLAQVEETRFFTAVLQALLALNGGKE
jgi:transposase-like protein